MWDIVKALKTCEKKYSFAKIFCVFIGRAVNAGVMVDLILSLP